MFSRDRLQNRDKRLTRLIGISDNRRAGSHTAALLRAATQLMPTRETLNVATIRSIPLSDGDVEAEGIPGVVTALKDQIAGADRLLLATPEYDGSLPGLFKSAMHWLTRPPADMRRVFGGKLVAVIGAALGAFGTILGPNAWLPVLRKIGTEPWFGDRRMVSRAHEAFDANGTLGYRGRRTAPEVPGGFCRICAIAP